MNAPAITDEIEDIEAAQLAYDRSGAGYEWQGETIHWSERHHGLWLAFARNANQTAEQDSLMAMWLGGLETPDDLSLMERRWRKDPDSIFDELAEFYGGFYKNDPDVADAVAVFYGQIMVDIDASNNELAPGGDGEGVPPK